MLPRIREPDSPQFKDTYRVITQQSLAGVTQADVYLTAFLESYQQERELDGKVLVDVGCNCAGYLPRIAQRFAGLSVIGVDVDGKAVSHAQERAEAAGIGNLRYRALDAAGLDAGSADILTSMYSLHEMDLGVFASAAYRALRLRGAVVILDHNREATGRILSFPDAAIIDGVPELSTKVLYQFDQLVARNEITAAQRDGLLAQWYNPHHIISLASVMSAYTPQEISDSLQSAGFRVIDAATDDEKSFLAVQAWKE